MGAPSTELTATQNQTRKQDEQDAPLMIPPFYYDLSRFLLLQILQGKEQNLPLKGKQKTKKGLTQMRARFFSDLLMFVVFMTCYAMFNPFIATYALMSMSALKTAGILAGKEPSKFIDWVEFGAVMVFGLITILLHNPLFIKIKWPVLGLGFAVGMLACNLIKGQSFLKSLAKDFNLPKIDDSVWRKMDAAMFTNIVVKAAINLSVIFLMSDQAWFYMNFILPAFDITMLATIFYLGKPYFKQEPPLDRIKAADAILVHSNPHRQSNRTEFTPFYRCKMSALLHHVGKNEQRADVKPKTPAPTALPPV